MLTVQRGEKHNFQNTEDRWGGGGGIIILENGNRNPSERKKQGVSCTETNSYGTVIDVFLQLC